MTELAIPNNNAIAQDDRQPPNDPTGGRLVAWSSALEAAHRIGTALCNTAFAPAHFRNKPDDAAAAVLMGDEIGLSPTQALRSIYVVSGNPGLYSRQMVAIVLHHGHEVWTVEKNDSKVTVAGRRRGSQHITEETWTIARATKAGYTNNKKYMTDPQAMLYSRAAGDVCRQIAPDALAGLAYSVEELELEAPAATVTVTRSTGRPTSIRRKQPNPPAGDEPDFDTEEPANPEPVYRSESQSKRLFATARDSGVSNDELKPFMASILGRDVDSSKMLTKAEAAKVIDALEQARDADPDTGELPVEGELEPDGGWPDVAKAGVV